MQMKAVVLELIQTISINLFFVLAGVCVTDHNWHKINDYFEKEKIEIYPEFKNIEIHTNELFNSNRKSPFYKNHWKDNFRILEKLVDLITNLEIRISDVVVYKKAYKGHFGTSIIVDPYLYSYAVLYKYFNNFLEKHEDYGIVFCDELRKMEDSLEILYPRLKIENKHIIEKTFYLNSKKNNFIQIADICSFYINKYNCIKRGTFTMDSFKKEHCIRMYEKLSKKFGSYIDNVDLSSYDTYFA